MGNARKFRAPITILLIFILIMYIAVSTGMIIALLNANVTVEFVLVQLSEYFKYIGFDFNTSLALLIIPATILLIINIKKIALDTRYAISQILSFISVIVILLSLVIPFLVYLTWLENQPGMDIQVWGTVIPIFIVYVVELLLNLIVFILLTIKRD